jgi:ADP-ribose pyrophosphatase YjhB (NUDIX family)
MGVLDGWRFCPKCGESIQREDGRVACPACRFVAYANSAPTASALVTDDRGRLLMARRAIDPYRGMWDLPGGFLEEGEDPVAALRRELREETGLEIEPFELLGAFVDWYGPERGEGVQATLNLYWTARAVSGDACPADDVGELQWFEPDDLPDELAFSNLRRVLDAWRQPPRDRSGTFGPES